MFAIITAILTRSSSTGFKAFVATSRIVREDGRKILENRMNLERHERGYIRGNFSLPALYKNI